MDKPSMYKFAYDLNISKDIASALSLMNTMSTDSIKLWTKKANDRYGTDYSLDTLKLMLTDINSLAVDDTDVVSKQAVLKIIANAVIKSEVYTPTLSEKKLTENTTILSLFEDVESTELSEDFEKVFGKEINVYKLIDNIKDKLDILESIDSEDVKTTVGEIRQSIEAFGPQAEIEKIPEVDSQISTEDTKDVSETIATTEPVKSEETSEEKKSTETKEPETIETPKKEVKEDVKPNTEPAPTQESTKEVEPNPEEIPEVKDPESKPSEEVPKPEVEEPKKEELPNEETKTEQLSKEVAQLLRDSAIEISKKSRELDIKTELIDGYKKKVVSLRTELDELKEKHTNGVAELQTYKNKESELKKQKRDTSVNELIELYKELGIEKTSEHFGDIKDDKILELKGDLEVLKKNTGKETTKRSTKRSVELKTTPKKTVNSEVEQFNVLFGKL